MKWILLNLLHLFVLFSHFTSGITVRISSKDNYKKDWHHTIKTADSNLGNVKYFAEGLHTLSDEPNDLSPGNEAQPFHLFTLNGAIKYPSSLFDGSSIIFHAFNNKSAFLECLWTSQYSLNSLVQDFPNNTHLVVIPTSLDPLSDAQWMQKQVKIALKYYSNKKASQSLLDVTHFVITSLDEVGNWISAAFREYACSGHGCGLSQAVFNNDDALKPPLILKRLDPRYDWLPSPESVFKNQSNEVILAFSGCSINETVNKKIALVQAGGCSYSKKVNAMESSGAIGVLVYAESGHPVDDMNCVDDECFTPPSIPASMIPWDKELLDRLSQGAINVTFQTTPSDNFYFAVDAQGLLSEFGWLLYPSFQFFNWQAQWFNYQTDLLGRLSQEALVIPVINGSIMQGDAGVVSTVKLPSMEELLKYDKFELDASLSCPGTRDEDCPPWDHTVQLYVCCDPESPLCGQELGRWITPFRRRIGRWLTDVTALLPLLTSSTCNFTMKTVPWAAAWKPSLNLRFSKTSTGVSSSSALKPVTITPLFVGGTFDKKYNQKYHPINFTIPSDVKQVKIAAIITGHGSDENGCGEFCVTSHHFVVDGSHPNVETFNNAGTPLGCAERSPLGVEPNEHGTWLYGRDGWCDGREVDPWVFDVTDDLNSGSSHSVTYFGWFNGTDPDPVSNPGEIIMYSYLVFYKAK